MRKHGGKITRRGLDEKTRRIDRRQRQRNRRHTHTYARRYHQHQQPRDRQGTRRQRQTRRAGREMRPAFSFGRLPTATGAATGDRQQARRQARRHARTLAARRRDRGRRHVRRRQGESGREAVQTAARHRRQIESEAQRPGAARLLPNENATTGGATDGGNVVVKHSEMTRKHAETKTKKYYNSPFSRLFCPIVRNPHLWYNIRRCNS